MFDPNYYFSIENSSHSSLFNEEFVWNIIKKLPTYIRSLDLGKIHIEIPNNVYLENPHLISIGEGTIIEPGVFIKGPVFIGKNCQIRHGAYIRENVILEEGAFVGHNSEIKNSILLKNAHAAHFNYVGDSILGCNTNLGAGVKCANVRFDRKEIFFLKTATHLKKLGLILGDDSQIGCNSVTNPGTFIGKKVFSPPGIVVKGYISSKSKIIVKCMYSVEEGNKE